MPRYRTVVQQTWSTSITDAYEAQDIDDALAIAEREYAQDGTKPSATLFVIDVDNIKIKAV